MNRERVIVSRSGRFQIRRCSVKQMVIDSIRITLSGRVVILKEKKGKRYLPIWVGPAEADAIAVKLQNVELSRPLTHDLLRSVLSAWGASVDRVVVSGLEADTFHAKLVLSVNGSKLDIDSRPSDALALAVRVESPIYAAESVLEAAGITPKAGQELEQLPALKNCIYTT